MIIGNYLFHRLIIKKWLSCGIDIMKYPIDDKKKVNKNKKEVNKND